MSSEKKRILIDFDGTLTDEAAQAAELSGVAIEMLAKILGCSVPEVGLHYQAVKTRILSEPQHHSWMVNGLPACYAYEGAYLLNTAILQEIIKSEKAHLELVARKFPPTSLDSITLCVNYLFHNGSLAVNPHFLPGVDDFLHRLLGDESIMPVIFTNSETRKIANNLRQLEIGQMGTNHGFEREIGILGDTRQYQLQADWGQTFTHPAYGEIQVLTIDDNFLVELRRPVYYAALRREIEIGYDQVTVVADVFSLAGALPLFMGANFVLAKTGHTPSWAEEFVVGHPRGFVALGLDEMEKAIRS